MTLPTTISKVIDQQATLPCFYPKGSILFHEDEPCNMVGIILEGVVKLIHYSHDGDVIPLGELTPGETMGDVILHDALGTYPGTLIAHTEVTVRYLRKDSILALITNDADFKLWYLQNIAKKFKSLNYHYKLLSQRTLRKKIIYWLETSVNNKGTVAIDSITDLAEKFQVTRPSLSRELGLLKELEIIKYNRSYIQLLEKK